MVAASLQLLLFIFPLARGDVIHHRRIAASSAFIASSATCHIAVAPSSPTKPTSLTMCRRYRHLPPLSVISSEHPAGEDVREDYFVAVIMRHLCRYSCSSSSSPYRPTTSRRDLFSSVASSVPAISSVATSLVLLHPAVFRPRVACAADEPSILHRALGGADEEEDPLVAFGKSLGGMTFGDDTPANRIAGPASSSFGDASPPSSSSASTLLSQPVADLTKTLREKAGSRRRTIDPRTH